MACFCLEWGGEEMIWTFWGSKWMQRFLFSCKEIDTWILSSDFSELKWQLFSLISIQLVDRCLDDVHQHGTHNVYVASSQHIYLLLLCRTHKKSIVLSSPRAFLNNKSCCASSKIKFDFFGYNKSLNAEVWSSHILMVLHGIGYKVRGEDICCCLFCIIISTIFYWVVHCNEVFILML